ncbi:MAG: FAD-dependent oxidoreductase [Kiritimatiellia bacterium]
MKTSSPQDTYDVVVAGAGPAGVAAAIASARSGARTLLVEPQNALGGVWTSGLLSLILDAGNKPGIMKEIRERLRGREGVAENRDLYDAEVMKRVLEELCAESGVEVLLHSKVADADVEGATITRVYLECKEGRIPVTGRCFVDTTGDGDLAARAGCGFDLGRDGDGKTQPLSLMALIAGVPADDRNRNEGTSGTASCLPKDEFLESLRNTGYDPSYTRPSLFPLPNGLCALMANHQYECSGLRSADLTRATLDARREIHLTVEAMRRFGGDWDKIRLISTAAHIGVREGRRIHGLYRITVDDVASGARHADAIARCTFGIDIHTPTRQEGGGYTNEGVTSLPYDIPLRALIARDRDNLVMAGRCISGDFSAHASYRVTGNAVATGEAAGTAAALAALRDIPVATLPFSDVLERLVQGNARIAE